MRFYLVDDETLITIPESMVKNEIKSLWKKLDFANPPIYL
jgi:hypothetical protein